MNPITSEPKSRIGRIGMKLGLFRPLTLRDRVIIALVATLSIAVKPYVHSIFAPATAIVNLPAGVLAGSLYMFWLVLVGYLINKPGAVLELCLLQGLLATIIGMTGKLGAMTIMVYMAPGVAMELLYLGLSVSWRCCRCSWTCSILSGAAANVAGAATMTALVVSTNPAVLFAGGLASAITGGVGGLMGFTAGNRIRAALGQPVHPVAGTVLARDGGTDPANDS